MTSQCKKIQMKRDMKVIEARLSEMKKKKKCSPAAVGHLLDNKVLNVASPNI